MLPSILLHKRIVGQSKQIIQSIAPWNESESSSVDVITSCNKFGKIVSSKDDVFEALKKKIAWKYTDNCLTNSGETQIVNGSNLSSHFLFCVESPGIEHFILIALSNLFSK